MSQRWDVWRHSRAFAVLLHEGQAGLQIRSCRLGTAVCFDYLHFASPNLPPQSNGLLQGDNVAETTLGLNWYLNDYTRMMFNYVHAVPVDPNFGPSWDNAFFVETAVFW